MVQIREATLADCASIEQLIEQSVWGLASEDYSREQIRGALAHAWGLDTQLIRDSTYFAVEDDGMLVGCGGWSFRRTLFGNDAAGGRDPARADPTVDPARIRAFFVHPDHARRGIGSRLMQLCEERAHAQGFRRLELMATLPGKRLYERHGFEAGTPVNYPLGGDLHIEFVPMVRTLSDTA